jgi:hypothetical protein
MSMTTLVTGALALIFLILYLLRRRSRLRADD